MHISALDLTSNCVKSLTNELILSQATDGENIFGVGSTGTEVSSCNLDGEKLLKLFSEAAAKRTIYSQGWLYSTADYNPTRLVRYPSSVGRLPQTVLPADIAGPAFPTASSENAFAVSSVGNFWSQTVSDKSQGQYIFYALLPAQPCDATLPCADSTQVCTSGLCG